MTTYQTIRSLIQAGLENAEAIREDGNRSHDWLIGYRMALEGLEMALPVDDSYQTKEEGERFAAEDIERERLIRESRLRY